jgi:hypothetical protein
MKRPLILLIGVFTLGLLASGVGLAQESFLGVNYSVSVPIGDTKEWTSKMSWRGIGIDYRKFRDRDLSLGFSAAWNVFNEKEHATTARPSVSGHITGTQFRYINSFPLMVTAHRYFGGGGRQDTRGYVGTGVGVIAHERRIELGLFADEKNRWHFGIAPEIGIIKPINWDTSFFGAVKWNYGFKSSNQTVSYISLNVGFAN